MPTCPKCGHTWVDEKEQARRERYEASRGSRAEERREYQRDYQRGRRHGRAGREPEDGASDAYVRGYASGARS